MKRTLYGPVHEIVMWTIDRTAHLSLCCNAPIEARELPDVLDSGRKPAVKYLRRCAKCKTDNCYDYRSNL
jgi:hypothetical protein